MRLNEFDSLEILSFQNNKHEFQNHFHETYVISIVEKGTLKENNLFGTTGSILISHPNEIHENKLFDNNEHSFTSFYVNPDVIKHVGKRDNILFKNKIINDPALFNHFQKFSLTIKSNKFDNQLSLKKGLNQLITSHSNDAIFQPNSEICFFEEVLYFIDKNCHQKIKLDDLATLLRLNKYQFIRKFKNNFGITPFEYINLQRTSRSKKLLKQGVSIIDVAFSTGFYDQSHFTKYFKRYVGLSPMEYLNKRNILQDFNLISN